MKHENYKSPHSSPPIRIPNWTCSFLSFLSLFPSFLLIFPENDSSLMATITKIIFKCDSFSVNSFAVWDKWSFRKICSVVAVFHNESLKIRSRSLSIKLR